MEVETQASTPRRKPPPGRRNPTAHRQDPDRRVKDVAGFAVNRLLHAMLIEVASWWRRESLVLKTSTRPADWASAIRSDPSP
ncbi:hypothetical protein ACRAWD_22800 [Caulobacter segnis]